MKIGIIIASVRKERIGDQVANWVFDQSKNREGINYEIVDLKDYPLPHYGTEETSVINQWLEKIKELDGYVFVVPEYNRMIPGAFKNALDYLRNGEVKDKAVAFVGYGGYGAMASIGSLRTLTGQLEMADVGPMVNLSLRTDFEKFHIFKPQEHHVELLTNELDVLENWSKAFKTIRK